MWERFFFFFCQYFKSFRRVRKQENIQSLRIPLMDKEKFTVLKHLSYSSIFNTKLVFRVVFILSIKIDRTLKIC